MSKITLGSIKNRIIASDLITERANRDFDNEGNDAFLNLLDPKVVGYWKMIWQTMQTTPELENKHTEYEMTREEMWKNHMRKFNYAFKNHKQEWFVNHNTEGPYWCIFLLG
jgi:hypothetical protein